MKNYIKKKIRQHQEELTGLYMDNAFYNDVPEYKETHQYKMTQMAIKWVTFKIIIYKSLIFQS